MSGLLLVFTDRPTEGQAVQVAVSTLPEAPLPRPGVSAAYDPGSASSSQALQQGPPAAVNETEEQKTERERSEEQVRRQEKTADAGNHAWFQHCL